MATLHPPELDSGTTTEANSPVLGETVRFMCSFGGKILPRLHDNQLRYVGGDTRIVSVPRRSITFSALSLRLSRMAKAGPDVTVKYQLPNEDLDALITLAADEDLENMMDEHDRNPNSRLRLFLFSNDPVSRTSSISSLLDGSTKRQNWFLDALNGGSGCDPGSGHRPALERGQSEASSMVSEVPDYLFGLDNSDDQPKSKTRLNMVDNISNSDPGSPAPAISSPYCSASSSIPDFPLVKVKPNVYQVDNFGEQPLRHYIPDAQYPTPTAQHMPVYYVPGSNVPMYVVPARTPYHVQQFQPMPGQIPVGYNDPRSGLGQMYGVGTGNVTMMDPHNVPGRAISDNTNQAMYYRSPFPGMVVPGGEEMTVVGSDGKLDRANQPR